MSTPPISTPSSGAGTAAAGLSPAGFGSPALAADSPDPSAGSRYINPQTGDYEVDAATGQLAQMPKARQQVLLALKTVFGSSTAQPRFGLLAPRKIGPNYVNQTKAAVRSALAHLTREDAPVIRIQGILVDRAGPGRIVVTVAFFDVRSGRPDEAQTVIA